MSRRKNAKKKVTRKGRGKSASNLVQIQEAMRWLIDSRIFAGLPLHGNTHWRPMELVTLAIFWIWSATPQLTEAFVDARIQVEKLAGRCPVTSYQGLLKALVSKTARFMPLLQIQLHKLTAEIAGKHFRVGNWVAIAIDGSRESAPRTQSNEKAFCAKNYGHGQTATYRKKKTKGMRRAKNKEAPPAPPAPQVWLTMMWHIGLGLPWCWKIGPSNSAERNHVGEMIKTGDFPRKTLFVGDAGFVGYEFWKQILDGGHHFLVRVGANVNLLSDLCPDIPERKGIVHCWPDKFMRRKVPPLTLRLVKCRIGHKKVWMLTSVLAKKELHMNEIVTLYKKRWGVELEFRGLKQTFNRRKLRCRSSERVLVEMEWSIFGMAAVELLALKEQMVQRAARPEKLSFAQSLTVIRRSLQGLTHRPEHLHDFSQLLRAALIDNYERKRPKEARYKPASATKPSCGQPKITCANREHRELLEKIEFQTAS